VRQRVLHSEPYAAQVDRDHAVEGVFAELRHEGALALDAGVVVHNVRHAELFDGRGDHRLRVLLFRDVGAQRDGLAAGRLDIARGLGSGALVDIDRGHPRALDGEKQRARAAHPRACARYQRHLVAKLHPTLSRRFFAQICPAQ
jgi:hypothetical protein